MLPSLVKNKKTLKKLTLSKIEGINLNNKKITFYCVEEEKNKFYFSCKKELIKFLKNKI